MYPYPNSLSTAQGLLKEIPPGRSFHHGCDRVGSFVEVQGRTGVCTGSAYAFQGTPQFPANILDKALAKAELDALLH